MAMAAALRARFGAAFTVLTLSAGFATAGFATAAFADDGSGGGLSTPGVAVTAQNPGDSPLGSDLRITLTAHTEQSAVPNPDCRPSAPTLRCWGSLVLRIPDFGGLSVADFVVHRVAVGDISCGGCEGDEAGETAPAAAADEPDQAQVNGAAVLVNPGKSGLDPGTAVQVKITLADDGAGLYEDTVDVQVNQFVPGPSKPLVYDTGPQTVQRVQIHDVGRPG